MLGPQVRPEFTRLDHIMSLHAEPVGEEPPGATVY